MGDKERGVIKVLISWVVFDLELGYWDICGDKVVDIVVRVVFVVDVSFGVLGLNIWNIMYILYIVKFYLFVVVNVCG